MIAAAYEVHYEPHDCNSRAVAVAIEHEAQVCCHKALFMLSTATLLHP
jgi:hypothetical protein